VDPVIFVAAVVLHNIPLTGLGATHWRICSRPGVLLLRNACRHAWPCPQHTRNLELSSPNFASKYGERLHAYLWGSSIHVLHVRLDCTVFFLIILSFFFSSSPLLWPSARAVTWSRYSPQHGWTEHLESRCHWHSAVKPQLFNRSRDPPGRLFWEAFLANCGPDVVRIFCASNAQQSCCSSFEASSESTSECQPPRPRWMHLQGHSVAFQGGPQVFSILACFAWTFTSFSLFNVP
jgi:hypothetical protein